MLRMRASFARIKDYGYSTCAFGKWYDTPAMKTTAAGPVVLHPKMRLGPANTEWNFSGDIACRNSPHQPWETSRIS